MELMASSTSTLTTAQVLKSVSAESASKSSSLDLEEELIIDNVKISPKSMLFENAYDGKHYSRKLVIQNCGSKLAFVRMANANSKSFEIKSFVRGYNLSPGLKIVRTVNYVYRATIPVTRGFVPIYINEKLVDYPFLVTLSMAVLSLEPQQLHFGRIDAVNVATTRTLHIKNSGCKGTQFAIDLGRNELELMVEPMKGTVPAKTSVPIRVEIVGIKEGEFLEEFWIKTSPPLRVVLTGTFISPKLVVRKFITGLDFTLMDFPPTYFGANTTRPLLIKNSSSSHSMFYLMGEIKGAPVPLDEARKIDENFANFSMMPFDGRLAAEKGSIIQMTFSPIKSIYKEKHYAACFVKCFRIDCRDVYNNEIDDPNSKPPTRPSPVSTNSNLTSPSKESFFDEDETLSLDAMTYADLETSHLSFEHAIGICLYGEKVRAGVSLRPTFIILDDLIVNKTYDRVICIKNQSNLLPITVKYLKAASIDVFPNIIDIGPSGSKEVQVSIKSVKFGDISKQIHFDLVYPDYPRKKGIIRKVGSASLNIHLNVTTMETLPRLEQCLLCYELPMKLPTQLRYRLTPSQLEMKKKNENYYLNYIKDLRLDREVANFVPEIEEYQLTNTKLVKRQEVHCQNPPPKPKEVISYSPFIPLAPRQLFHVKITPKSMRLRKVAAYTTITEHFEIENLNPFPIRIFVRASKPCIVFYDNDRYTIRSGEKKKIPFNFSTTIIGRYNVNITVLINFSTLFEVSAVAHVVPKTLRLESTDIQFLESDGHYKFFDVINGLNAQTKFDWDIPNGCFQIFPSEGKIKAESILTTMVVYEPDPAQPAMTECTLNSESGQKKIVQFSFKKRKPAISFDTYEVDFGLIPLNIPVRRKIVMRNEKDFKVLFYIINFEPIPGVVVQPQEGALVEKDSQIFIISICLDAVIDFSTDIIITVDEESEFKIAVKASVEFPKFSITPDMLHFSKTAVYSIDTLTFKVKNLSQGELWLWFPIEEFPEFSITDQEEVQLPHQEKIVLSRNEAKILFLHFHPDYISTFSFAFPYIINGIIGPVYLNSNQTQKAQYFLHDNEMKYQQFEGVTINEKIPQNLPIIRVNSSAVDKFLEFSNLHIKLVYFGKGHYNNKTTSDFEITNTSGSASRVCIRTDELGEPFSLTLKSEKEIVCYPVSYMMELEPGEKIVFEASFQPDTYGEYEVKLPIFLRHYFDNKIFNYLTLSGISDRPEITSSIDCIHFEPVPVKIKSEINLTLHMANHFENCLVKTLCDIKGLRCNFKNERDVKSKEDNLKVLVTYISYKQYCFDSTLTFQCSCNASYTVTVRGITDNCVITTHAFFYMLKTDYGIEELMSKAFDDNKVESTEVSTTSMIHPRFFDSVINKNTTTYPLFPSDDDDSIYACYMRRLQKTLENWIYTQGFYKQSYLRIPEGFTYYTKASDARKKSNYQFKVKKEKPRELPLLQLMINLTGGQFQEKLMPHVLESNKELDVLTYTYRTYIAILNYIRSFDVYLPHVKTKLLLNYEQYVLYEKLKWNPVPPMDKDTFEAYSKQCWIDLFLQIIKQFVLYRIIDSDVSNFSAEEEIGVKTERSPSSATHVSENIEADVDIGGEHERKIIEWLEDIYEDERLILWEGLEETPEPKQITFLEEDLRDGLILGAVTARYCPYVKDLLRCMYLRPIESEEIFHNACTLVKTWKALKFSIEISPFTIKNGELVEMLLLVTYLYEVLPSYYPIDTITIQAPLTLTNSKKIDMCNQGQDPIVYTVIWFGNENKLFQSAKRVTIQPGKAIKVTATYYAKCVGTAKASLVFSGETPGQKYGKSIAVDLVGIADVSYACMSIPINVNLYSPCEVVLNIQSPFKTKAEYTVFLGLHQGSNVDKNYKLYPWEELKRVKTVKECLLPSGFCEFDDNGFRCTKPVICCLEAGPRNIWVYYTNPEIGDWAVELNLTGKVSASSFEQLFINLPDNYDNLVCRCKKRPDVTKHCPSIIYMDVPCKNNKLWESRKAMTLRGVENEELRFWEKRIYKPIGTRILTLIYNSETHPLKQVIDQPVEYNVLLGKNAPFVTLKSIVIEDVNTEDYYKLPIHATKDLLQADNVTMRLVAKDGREKRFYKLHFNKRASVSSVQPNLEGVSKIQIKTIS